MDNKANMILHPVRMRILLALRGRKLTPLQLSDTLSDLAQATLYRHINALADAGLIRVVEERPVRGVTEKVYALAEKNAADLSAEDLQNATAEDHMRYFTIFTSVLLSDYSRYLKREERNLETDGVGYHQYPIYLSDTEFLQFVQELNAILIPIMNNQPGDERKRRLLSIILMPGDENTGSDKS